MSDVVIETDRLIIRDVTMPDREAFIHMASDGSLNDVGFDKDCSSWMHDWIIEAQNLVREDNPRKNYLAYVIEEEKKMYRDVNDANEELYRFYLAQRCDG